MSIHKISLDGLAKICYDAVGERTATVDKTKDQGWRGGTKKKEERRKKVTQTMNLSIDLTYFSMVKERKCIILSPEMLSMSGGEAEGGGGSSLERKSRRESSARVFFTVHTIYIHLLFVHC